MGINTKIDIFIFALILIPVLVDFLKPLHNWLKAYAQKSSFHPIHATLGLGLIFLFELSNPLTSIIVCLGFFLFFTNYAVALSFLRPYSSKSNAK